jgi:murein L,D-transpeptidase YcbB/YkuD
VRVLNVPCAERLATLLLNVRRWRHSAWHGEREWVQVNLAGQMLRYYRDGALVSANRTVVGSDKSYFSNYLQRRMWKNATPILRDTIATVIVNPEWNVPMRIVREELQPEIDKDPTYVEKHRFKTKKGGDGATYYVQEAGPGNALGRIKILFPNSESVYLHDTPGRNAFKLPVRALSHGCVRLDGAVDFGAELVRSDKAKRGEVFDAKTVKDMATLSTKTRVFELAQEVPVFLEYYTASVDEAGAVWFHPDIYGYDAETASPSLAAP